MSDITASDGGGYKALQRMISAAFCYSDTVCLIYEGGLGLVELSSPRWQEESATEHYRIFEGTVPLECHTLDYTVPDNISCSDMWVAMAVTKPTHGKIGSSRLMQLLPSVSLGSEDSIYIQLPPSERIRNLASKWEDAIEIRQKDISTDMESLREAYFPTRAMQIRLFQSMQKTVAVKEGSDRNARSIRPVYKLGDYGYVNNAVRYNLPKMECLDPRAGHFLWGARALFEMLPAVYFQRMNAIREYEDQPTSIFLETVAFVGDCAEMRAHLYMRQEQNRLLTAYKRVTSKSFCRTICLRDRSYTYQGREIIDAPRNLPLTEEDNKFLRTIGGIPLCSDIVMSNGTLPAPQEITLSGAARWSLILTHNDDDIRTLTNDCWT